MKTKRGGGPESKTGGTLDRKPRNFALDGKGKGKGFGVKKGRKILVPAVGDNSLVVNVR